MSDMVLMNKKGTNLEYLTYMIQVDMFNECNSQFNHREVKDLFPASSFLLVRIGK